MKPFGVNFRSSRPSHRLSSSHKQVIAHEGHPKEVLEERDELR